MSALQETLRGYLGVESVPALSPSQYAVDGREPQAIVMPATAEAVGRLIEWLGSHGHAVIPWGGGVAMGTGNPPAKYDVALDLWRVNHLVEYTPEDMTVTVEAGMTLGELQRVLSQHGQFLPVEAPDRATLGGLIASNRHGPSRLAWGMIRDWLLGVTFVRGDGKVVSGGGKVVKNVAGYDLCKLLVGSFGTLGVITEATFKVAPVPPAHFACLTDLAGLAPIQSLPVRPQFVEMLNKSACRAMGMEPIGDATVVIGVSGTPEEVEWQASQLARPPIAFSPSRLVELGADADVVLRIVGKYSEFESLHRQIVAHFGEDMLLSAHVQLGVFRCAMPVSSTLAASIRRLRQEYQVVIEHAPVALKTEVDAWGEVGSSLALMRKIKQQLDPREILGIGRFVGGI